MARLTTSDLKQIEKLNLKLVIDLRSKEEILAKPTRLPANQEIQYKNIAIYGIPEDPKRLKKRLFLGRLGGLNLKDEIMKVYQKAIADFQPQGKKLFELLLNPANYPVLILCNAGKDRTGVVIALILSALGVPRKIIIKDYMLSEKYLKWISRWLVIKVRLLSFFRADIVNLKHLLNTRVNYINELFSQIDRRFDSMESCLEDLGLNHDNREILNKLLCSEEAVV